MSGWPGEKWPESKTYGRTRFSGSKWRGHSCSEVC
uniref:Uncharacterized protein n=1 Tax=Anguilla anguilla TaxID=7936 RepID=A0A0E9Q2I4_ANGAN